MNLDSPPVFPPSAPELHEDDSYVTYYYYAAGTGYWAGDPEWILNGLTGSAEEVVCHHKQDGSESYSSRSISTDVQCTQQYCHDVPDSITNYYAFCGSTNAVGVDCTAVSLWFDSPIGTGPGSAGATDIREGPTTTDLPCGTSTKAYSFYEYTLNADGTGGGACGAIPKSILIGSGSLHELRLTLTPGCRSGQLSTAPAFCGSMCYIETSTKPSTPFANGFDTNGCFHISFIARSNALYSVQASTNLEFWEDVGQVSLEGTNTHGTFVDSNAPANTRRFYVIQDAATNCSDACGYVKVMIPAGYSMIANPLLGDSVRIGSLLGSVPDSTTLRLWDGTDWGQTATFSSGSWDHPYWALLPGGGALIHVTSGTTLTFVGEVIQGNITNNIPSGYSVRSSAVPQSGGVDELGLRGLADGDFVMKWNGSGYDTYSYRSGSWSPSTPALSLGESVIVHSGTATTWDRTFRTTLPPLTSNGQFVSHTEFRFDIKLPRAGSYEVDASENLSDWNKLRDVTVNTTGLSFSDATVAGVAHRFYRVRDSVSNSGAIGFTRLSIESGSWHMIANQLDNGDNSVERLFSQSATPIGISIYKQNSVGYDSSSYDPDIPGWSAPNLRLPPGEGAWIQNGDIADYEVTFVGHVLAGRLVNLLPQGSFIRSSMVPQAGLLVTDLECALVPGDSVCLWNGTGYDIYSNDMDVGWDPEQPSVDVGQCFWVVKAEAANWVRDFSVSP